MFDFFLFVLFPATLKSTLFAGSRVIEMSTPWNYKNSKGNYHYSNSNLYVYMQHFLEYCLIKILTFKMKKTIS